MITIYGKKSCPWCVKAVKLAETYEFKYTYIDIEEGNNREKLLEKLPDLKTVPQIWWHQRHLGGYENFSKEIEKTSTYGDNLF